MRSDSQGALKTLAQVAAIACMAVLCATILHKGYGDLSELAQQHSGEAFWRALAQYLLRNIGAGGPPADGPAPG